MNKDRLKRIIIRVLIYFVLGMFVILFLVPIYGAFTLSFKSFGDVAENYWGLPQKWILSGYKEALLDRNSGLFPHFINSFIITIPSVLLAILLSSMIAYPISRYKIRGAKAIFFLAIFGLTLPAQVLIIPIFRTLDFIHWYNTYQGMIFVHTAFGIPFATFVLRNFMISIPGDIQEAAIVDGCNVSGIYSKIILPLSIPALAVLGILMFTWTYNSFFWELILTVGRDKAPIQIGIAMYTASPEMGLHWELKAASAILATLPTLVLFLLAQRFFIKGITVGAVKG
jgi:multiple sugar transport system permease protein